MPKIDKLLSDQITRAELEVVLRYCTKTMYSLSEGDIVELGCYVGTTSIHLQKIALQFGRTLHVYDSFEGLPPKTLQDSSPAGLDFRAGELTASKKALITNFVKQNLPLPVIHKGWFSGLGDTDLPDQIAFAFLDGDFYQSIVDSFRVVWPRLRRDGFVLVHDYERTALPGVKRAVQQFLAAHHDARMVRAEQHIAVITKQL